MSTKQEKSFWDMNDYEFCRWQKDGEFIAQCDNFINSSLDGAYINPNQMQDDIVNLLNNAEAEAIGSALVVRGLHMRPSRRMPGREEIEALVRGHNRRLGNQGQHSNQRQRVEAQNNS